jgi:ribosomal protein S18 acetylase RimI-like enzyme
VVYEDVGSLQVALPELRERYAEHACAWTVWTWPGNDTAAKAMRAAGHTLDAAPAVMAMELEGLDGSPDPELDWTDAGDWPTLGTLNDAAYSYGDDSMSRAIGNPGMGPVWIASVGGEPAAGLALLEGGTNAHVLWVATDPRFGGRRLAGRLLRQALLQARARGARTSTLEATNRGEPAYAGIGFRALGTVGMWERRPGT